MQERHFRIEQNPIDNCEIHVPRANVNCRQGATMREGTRSDMDETAGQSHARQAGALTESVDANAVDAIRDRDACQAGAALEGKIPDVDETAGQSDARQAGALKEGGMPDADDLIGDRDACKVGALVEHAIPDACDAVGD